MFTRKELADARRLLRTHFGSYDFIPTSSAAAVQKGTRVARALYFIGAARADSDLGLKIANCCSALEALFGTATSELTHLLAERVSVFLEEDPEPRIQIYQAVRRSYALRSAVVHGSQIKASKADALRDAAKTLDDALRLALFKSASDTIRRSLLESTDPLIDASFLKILMGCSWDDAPVEALSFADPVRRREWIRDRNLQVFTLIDPDDPLREIDLFVEAPSRSKIFGLDP